MFYSFIHFKFSLICPLPSSPAVDQGTIILNKMMDYCWFIISSLHADGKSGGASQ